MARYLVFELSEDDAKRSNFADYTLGTSNLLPRYFGDLAPINIFLGENNSGKSRFMREIMKCDPARVFELDSLKELDELLVKGLEALLSKPLQNVGRIEFAFAHASHLTKKLVEFLFTKENPVTYGEMISVNPLDSIEVIKKIILLLRQFLTLPELFLDSVSGEGVSNIITQIQHNIFGLRKSADAYEAQQNGLFDGFNYSAYDNRGMYRTQDSTINFFTNGRPGYGIQPGYEGPSHTHAPVVLRSIISFVEPVVEFLDHISKQPVESRSRTYIPTLRTARTLTGTNKKKVSAEDDVLHSTIEEDYELARANVKINTGLALYSAIDGKRSSHLSDREEFKQFEDFLSETFFNGKLVEVVPNRRNTTILVAVDREERELPHLGDGIQAIILLLYPLFIATKRAWFFIEEPETHLHPGFQRLFIKTIATHPVLLEKELTVFLTTHSNHMLDFAFDEAKNINLFTFRKSLGDSKNASYQVQLTAPHDLACLTALGVQNSSVFLSNCTIWVEGITDRIYLKAYLEAYLAHQRQTFSLLEGLHYSFLEYAGANVAHYTFGAKSQQVSITDEALQSIQALSISNRIMLIADQDSGKDAKHERLTSQKHAGFEYVMLPVREIENLLTPEVIVAALQKMYPKQTFDAGLLKPEKYQTNYLAAYLRSRFPELRDTFVGKSGTISSTKKRDFAEAVASSITSWGLLSAEAQKLTK